MVWCYGAHNIGQQPKSELANDSTSACSQLDRSIGGCGHLSNARVVNNSQHCCEERDGKDIVRVREEADSGHENGSHMVPAEGGLVDLGEGKTTPLIGILDVGKIVVEVVVGSIASRCLGVGDGL